MVGIEYFFHTQIRVIKEIKMKIIKYYYNTNMFSHSIYSITEQYVNVFMSKLQIAEDQSP